MIIFLAVIGAMGALFFIDWRYQSTIVEISKSDRNNSSQPLLTRSTGSGQALRGEEKTTGSQSEIRNLKSAILLPVPFTPQAPTANWDQLHNEACEEASIIMANAYFSSSPSAPGKGRIQEKSNQSNADNMLIDPKTVESEIQKLTDWQQQTFGYYLSINFGID
mgnify:CR=1 FL=1